MITQNFKTAYLLDKLNNLTSTRDIEFLELSLLKTFSEILQIPEISLFKLNDYHEPYRLVRYCKNKVSAENVNIHGEGHEIAMGDIHLPKELLDAAHWARSLQKSCTLHGADGFCSVYPILGADIIVGYIVITLPAEPSVPENTFIEGLLRVFYNFYALLEDSQKDKLTGLLNRKTFDDNIDKVSSLILTHRISGETDERRQVPQPERRFYWLVIIDIDHFKKINDTFGHLYGDEVLLLLSQIMKANFRSNDLLFRFGGEEFVIIACANNQDGAKTAFERLREAVQNYRFPQVGQVTISLGAVQICERGVASELVGQADQALYHAKNHGRNRLFFYEDLIRSGDLKVPNQNSSIDFF